MRFSPTTLPGIMFTVCLALLPGTWQYAQQYGDIVWLQLAFTAGFCLLFEAFCLLFTGRALRELNNLSWLVCGMLLARALPLLTPAWLLALASFGAIVLAKYAGGGLGRNRLNPALVGLAVVSLCFYQLLPESIAPSSAWTASLNWQQTLALQLGIGADLPNDGSTLATALISDDLTAPAALAGWSGYLAGGLALALLRVIRLEIPLAMLGATFITGIALGLSAEPSLYNLSLGGLIFAAFFIATDPVTSPDNHLGRLLFGATIGTATELVRVYGLYADGLCFAILAANLLVPQFNRLGRSIQQPWFNRPGNNPRQIRLA